MTVRAPSARARCAANGIIDAIVKPSSMASHGSSGWANGHIPARIRWPMLGGTRHRRNRKGLTIATVMMDSIALLRSVCRPRLSSLLRSGAIRSDRDVDRMRFTGPTTVPAPRSAPTAVGDETNPTRLVASWAEPLPTRKSRVNQPESRQGSTARFVLGTILARIVRQAR